MEFQNLDDLDDPNLNLDYNSLAHPNHHQMLGSQMNVGLPRKKTKKFKDEESKKKWEDMMTIKRRKLFTSIVKKELGKQHRSKTNKHKEMLLQLKRVASHCVKHARQKAVRKI